MVSHHDAQFNYGSDDITPQIDTGLKHTDTAEEPNGNVNSSGTTFDRAEEFISRDASATVTAWSPSPTQLQIHNNTIEESHANRQPLPATGEGNPFLPATEGEKRPVLNQQVLTQLYLTGMNIDDGDVSQNSDHSLTEGDSASEAGKAEFTDENFGEQTQSAMVA